jgi:hypothetical protein
MSRHVLVLAALSLLLLATTDCQKSKSAEPEVDVTKLEELPKDTAAHLKRIPNSDLLVTEPPVVKEQSKPIVKPEPKQCFVSQDFYSQVLFPVTVCSPGPTFGTVLESYNRALGNSAQSIKADVHDFKLTNFEGQNLLNPIFCHQTSGPFYAAITKQTDCSGVSACVMIIQSVPQCPQCPTFVWFGDTCESSGRPTQVQFIGPLFAGPQQTFSCGGLSDCGDNPAPSPIVPAK